jgi:two-component system sensor histidine kinase MprB
VTDASHELRTPVTSLRTNAEVLRAQPDLPAAQRDEILDDLVAQADELGLLVADVIELARDGEPSTGGALEDLRLDELVAESVDRARRHAPAVTFELTSSPVLVTGDRERLGRAVNNLLDNAAGHGGASGRVEVRVGADGTVAVRDHGPGIPADELEHVFDRFWRGAGGRSRPGSGLGLAIVRQVAERHGGSVDAAQPDGPGALLTLRLPPAGDTTR